MPASQPTRLLEGGDRIDLGDRQFEVLHLPGVTAGACGDRTSESELEQWEGTVIPTPPAASFSKVQRYELGTPLFGHPSEKSTHHPQPTLLGQNSRRQGQTLLI